MARQRKGKTTARQSYPVQLRKAMAQTLPRKGLPLIVPDGRVRWTPRLLTITAVLMVWQKAAVLRDAFASSWDLTVEMHPSRRRPGYTFQGFCDSLRRQTPETMARLKPALRQLTRRRCGRRWRWRRWVVVIADGTRLNCCRTAANERVLLCAGKDRTGPQIMLTSIYHADSGLLLDWRRGPGTDAERTHLRQMIADLPRQSLLVADAGFTGFALMKELIQAGHDFVIRVGANTTLLRDLEYKQTRKDQMVYLWPSQQRDQEPLKLRLIRFRRGKQQVYLLTSVDSEQLSTQDAMALYKRRWGIEVAYRSLKQTMEKRKMLSRTPDLALLEVDWAQVGLWMLSLMAARQLRSSKLKRMSVAKSLRAVRQAMEWRRKRIPAGGLARQLGQALVDSYTREGAKASGNHPLKKQTKPPSPPNLRTATPAEKARLQRLRQRSAA